MRNACDLDSRCGVACDASARDIKSLAIRVERCEPLITSRKTTQNKKKKFPGTKFLGTFGPPPTEKTEKIGKIKGTLVRKVPGNLRSQELVFFVWAVFLPPN